MNNEDKIIQIMKQNNGLVTTKKVNDMNIPKVTLTRLVKKGIIQRQKKDYMYFQILLEMNIMKLFIMLKMQFFHI